MSLMSSNNRAGGWATSAECLISRMPGLSQDHCGLSFALEWSMAKPEKTERVIADNRKARFDYFIEERYEAGLVLQGWEVKAMRAGRAQLKEAYVYLRGGEAFLFGAHI